MLSEGFFSSICGPPIAANTAISKDIGIYSQVLAPTYTVKATFKKSSCPRHGLAVSSSHIFAIQDQKAQLHVYSRARGSQEVLVSFAERIRSIALTGNTLILGTTEGRLILWETCTGRQVTTPPCHVQPISCIAVTPHHVLSASEDSNINVWSLTRLLELDAQIESEPDLVLSNHRGAIVDLVAASSANPESSICVSASKDKTCIIWNYQTGQVLRTLLFPTPPLCISMDPCARALYVGSSGGTVYLVDLFGDKPLLGYRAQEPPSIVVQVNEPLAVAEDDAGEMNCIAGNYDGTSILTGHANGRILRWNLAPSGTPMQLANVNAAVTNIIFSPIIPPEEETLPVTVVKPSQTHRLHTFTSKLNEQASTTDSRFTKMFGAQGFSSDTLQKAHMAFSSLDEVDQLETEAEEISIPRISPKLLASMKASTFSPALGT
ncbi:pre-rRNA-processing protein IPI3 [Geosmithia morbida]|uniref:Pre-rRNA-processing protein IPI3 n=1 Tax=Geosmithia morbida TaxID=1094350 RepID=A0A9P4YTK9_9HYPO|nr:pre-rRNA-processing protein IPI3 [Geosmithia morbida]KAF4122871.1 pre-rRNA-processing protein IPI3 [Geosmithia morbida]